MGSGVAGAMPIGAPIGAAHFLLWLLLLSEKNGLLLHTICGAGPTRSVGGALLRGRGHPLLLRVHLVVGHEEGARLHMDRHCCGPSKPRRFAGQFVFRVARRRGKGLPEGMRTCCKD